jgi:hypothetical protein
MIGFRRIRIFFYIFGLVAAGELRTTNAADQPGQSHNPDAQGQAVEVNAPETGGNPEEDGEKIASLQDELFGRIAELGGDPERVFLDPTSTELARKIMELRESELIDPGELERKQQHFLGNGGLYILNFGSNFFPRLRTLNECTLLASKHYYTKCELTSWICNKLTAKLYVRDTVGARYTARIYGAFVTLEEVFDPRFWDRLPERFVVKGVLGSYGRFVRVVDKRNPETVEAVLEMVNPKTSRVTKERFIVEEFFPSPNQGRTVPDYKFYCSFGKVLFVAVGDGPSGSGHVHVTEKFKTLYTVGDWTRLEVTHCGRERTHIDKPEKLAEMVEVARKLSQRFPMVRIDLYLTLNERGQKVVKVGELTTLPAWGCGVFVPVSFELLAGAFVPVMSEDDFEFLLQRDFESVEKWKNQLRKSPDFRRGVVMPGFKVNPHICFDSMLKWSAPRVLRASEGQESGMAQHHLVRNGSGFTIIGSLPKKSSPKGSKLNQRPNSFRRKIGEPEFKEERCAFRRGKNELGFTKIQPRYLEDYDFLGGIHTP